MGYVDKTLLPGERVVHRSRLHWIIYVKAYFCFLCGFVALTLRLWLTKDFGVYVYVGSALFLILGAVFFLIEWIDRFATEFVVTDKRVVKKVGLIRRDTQEMNLAKIESVQLHQSILGRLLGYGIVLVIGTGGSAQIESGSKRNRWIESPIKFRQVVQSLSHI